MVQASSVDQLVAESQRLREILLREAGVLENFADGLRHEARILRDEYGTTGSREEGDHDGEYRAQEQ
jgi:hypothetical protein